ncbi:MAG: ThuA domain-containing protein [Chthonomonadaceae bacterium]|nr:ThuA domain-containing protein [Chthonomonadaceae bacterium]
MTYKSDKGSLQFERCKAASGAKILREKQLRAARYDSRMLLTLAVAMDLTSDRIDLDGDGARRIVLIAGDEEYRSEEMLPQLASILEKRHGFKCDVLHSIAQDGTIDPTVTTNEPRLDLLDRANLVIIMTRFRCWPDAQMARFVKYVESKKPIIGIRTATHAFAYPKDSPSPFAKFSWDSTVWPGGFGKQILGETWVAHHGTHMVESTRAVPAPGAEQDPILRGVKDLWVPTDVYASNPMESETLMLGQVLDGMEPGSKTVGGTKNSPMIPVAWKKETDGRRVFTTTMGSAVDFLNQGFRRLLVNACFWCLNKPVPRRANVSFVGNYEPSPIGFGKHKKGAFPTSSGGRPR